MGSEMCIRDRFELADRIQRDLMTDDFDQDNDLDAIYASLESNLRDLSEKVKILEWFMDGNLDDGDFIKYFQQ